MRTRRTIPVDNDTGIQTTDVTGKTAGFYSSMFGSVPFSMGRGLKHDTFIVEVHQGP